MASPNQGVCMCTIGTVLTNGVCVPIKDIEKKNTVAISAGTTVAILAGGALVGFLCWWFICRTKRADISSDVTTLIRTKST